MARNKEESAQAPVEDTPTPAEDTSENIPTTRMDATEMRGHLTKLLTAAREGHNEDIALSLDWALRCTVANIQRAPKRKLTPEELEERKKANAVVAKMRTSQRKQAGEALWEAAPEFITEFSASLMNAQAVRDWFSAVDAEGAPLYLNEDKLLAVHWDTDGYEIPATDVPQHEERSDNGVPLTAFMLVQAKGNFVIRKEGKRQAYKLVG